MRLLLVPLALALALAGCFGGGDTETPSPTPGAPTPTTGDPTPTPASPSPTPASPTPTSTPPASPTPTTPTPGTPTPPAPLPPIEVVNETFDYGSGEAAGPDGKVVTFDVPEGYETVSFDVRVESQGQGTLPDLSVTGGTFEIIDPDGNVVVEGVEEQQVEVDATPGEWQIKYTGTGTETVTTVGIATA